MKKKMAMMCIAGVMAVSGSLTVEYKKNARRPYSTCFFCVNFSVLFYSIL